jgi:hypothetical protein
LLDVESLAGHLIAPGCVFGFLAAHRSRLFPPELFSDLFPTRRGRPSLAPEVVASVLVLQALRGLSAAKRSRLCGSICGEKPRAGSRSPTPASCRWCAEGARARHDMAQTWRSRRRYRS